MATEHVVVIEDDEDILELIRYNLAKEGYKVSGAASGEEGLKTVRATLPNLVLLDLMLPGIDGLEVCRRLKADAKTAQTPVIIVTAKGEESDVVVGLEIGADDYVTKPFSPKVLLARARNVLRRKTAALPDDSASLQIHNLVIHPWPP